MDRLHSMRVFSRVIEQGSRPHHEHRGRTGSQRSRKDYGGAAAVAALDDPLAGQTL